MTDFPSLSITCRYALSTSAHAVFDLFLDTDQGPKWTDDTEGMFLIQDAGVACTAVSGQTIGARKRQSTLFRQESPAMSRGPDDLLKY